MPRHFEIEIDQLRANIIKMGNLVDEQIGLAIQALLGSNMELASVVFDCDRKVDEFDNLIDEQCERLFALTQPVATDLRMVMSALKMNNEFERIGDIAVNLVERIKPISKYVELIHKTKLSEMAEVARLMVKQAIDAFVHNDAALARKICLNDDIVDNLNGQIFQQLIYEMKQNPSVIEPATHIMILSRHLERLADHATNVAEDVVFLVDAKIIKHHAEE